MKKYITLAALLTAGTAFANAGEVNLNPTYNATTENNGLASPATLNENGISTTDVWNYEFNEWHGTYAQKSLTNQAGVTQGGVLSLQLGNAASIDKGNFLAVKFKLEEFETPTSLSFTYEKASHWGEDSSTFACNYVCELYGFNDSGESMSLGSWTQEVKRTDSLNEDKYV